MTISSSLARSTAEEERAGTHTINVLRQERVDDGVGRDAGACCGRGDEMVEGFRVGEDDASDGAQVCERMLRIR